MISEMKQPEQQKRSGFNPVLIAAIAAVALAGLCGCIFCGTLLLGADPPDRTAELAPEATSTEPPPPTQPSSEPEDQEDLPSPMEVLVLTMDAVETSQALGLTATAEPASAETPQPTAITELGNFSPGTYLVGSDIEPGIYQGQAGEDFLSSCYWARLSDVSGDFDAILANDVGIGQFYVEVKATDFALQTACGLASLDLLPASQEAFPDAIVAGTYLVGRDIAPGIYRGEAGEDIDELCYWARLSDVSGDFDNILANNVGMGQFFVEVLSSDFALKTHCPLTRTEN